jgi:predicted DNA-binding transcriptional regulator YafY
VDGYLKRSWEIIVDDRAPETRVVIDVDAKVAGNVIETRWHPSQSVEVRADGSARLSFAVSGVEEVFWWVMGMGRHARVMAPRELRDRVRSEAEAMLRSSGAGP